jgi:hypothetical protein
MPCVFAHGPRPASHIRQASPKKTHDSVPQTSSDRYGNNPRREDGDADRVAVAVGEKSHQDSCTSGASRTNGRHETLLNLCQRIRAAKP